MSKELRTRGAKSNTYSERAARGVTGGMAIVEKIGSTVIELFRFLKFY